MGTFKTHLEITNMNEETQQMFVALNKQLSDVVLLVRQVNERSEEALLKVRELVDLVTPLNPDDLR